MLELLLNGKGPKAILLRDADSILCTGAIIAEEFFADECPWIPIISAIGKEDFDILVTSSHGSPLTITEFETDNMNCETQVEIIMGREKIITRNLLKLKDTLNVESLDESFNGSSEAKAAALRTVKRVASISHTTELLPITCAHIDAVTFIGQGGLRFARKLVEMGGRVSVPTTLNSQSVDRRRWQKLGVDADLAKNANAVGDAYLQLGCQVSFTCAPYLLPTKPAFGDNIMWGESNAVVYSNSVLGARTEKYADYFDICAAIIGKVPNIGVHLESNRRPKIILDATDIIQEYILPSIGDTGLPVDSDIDSFFPVMGWLCGYLSDGNIPLVLGFDLLPNVTQDDLKSFSAAYGTTGSAPLFHMAGITPEARKRSDLEIMMDGCTKGRLEITIDQVRMAHTSLDGGACQSDSDDTFSTRVDLIALGNPHLSLTELQQLTAMIRSDSRPKNNDVRVIATLSRYIESKGEELGVVQQLKNFGVEFINDTCWCMLLDPPIIPKQTNAQILTNSGKYAHYGPALTSRKLRFASLRDCVETAKSGRLRSNNKARPQWLRSFSTNDILAILKRVK
jgi:predicted aconitase